jgi:dihydrofolate reductase
MIGMIAAVSSNGVIGVDDKLPFDYPTDMKYFRETTKGATIIFGRKTFESIGRALPKRRNIVISRTKVEVPGVETFSSVAEAMSDINEKHQGIVKLYEATPGVEAAIDILILPPNVWFAGGTRIYEAGMDYAEEIHLTTTPDVIDREDAVRFPFINPRKFEISSWNRLDPTDDTLRLYIYKKIK